MHVFSSSLCLPRGCSVASGLEGRVGLSGCYFLFTRWEHHKTHPGPSPGLAGDVVGMDEVCFVHSFMLEMSVDTAVCRAPVGQRQTWAGPVLR